MEGMANVASSSTNAQDVQLFRQYMLQNDLLMEETAELDQQHLFGSMKRSMQNRMSDEINAVLSDVMASMKRTGDEIRNAGR